MKGVFRLGVAAASGRPAHGGGGDVVAGGWDSASIVGAATVTSGGGTVGTSAPSVGHVGVRGLIGRSSGKRYFEMSHSGLATQNGHRLGIAAAAWDRSGVLGNTNLGAAISANGYAYKNGLQSTYIGAFPGSPGVITRFAIDFDLGRMWIGLNAGWGWSGDPANNTNPALTGIAGEWFPALSNAGQGTTWAVTLHEKADEFSYPVPAGFAPWGA